jgi:hypothetical protein
MDNNGKPVTITTTVADPPVLGRCAVGVPDGLVRIACGVTEPYGATGPPPASSPRLVRYPLMMRTTLDIDDPVLEFARDRAKAEGVSLGRMISELARVGVDAALVTGVGHGLVRQPDGLVTLDPLRGATVTTERVDAALAEFDLEDAGLRG